MSLSEDNYDGLTTQGRAPLDPSTVLPPRRICDRVSGPTQGNHEGLPLRGRGWIPGRGSGHGGGCAFRRDGFLPPQE